MSEFQKSLNVLFEKAQTYPSDYSGVDGTYDQLIEPIDVARKCIQELVDKVPIYEKLEERASLRKVCEIRSRYKNPYISDGRIEILGNCPRCDTFVFKEVHRRFCPECGQMLNWSKDE